MYPPEGHTIMCLNREANRLSESHTKTSFSIVASHQPDKDLLAIMPTGTTIDKEALVVICHIEHRTGMGTMHQCLGTSTCPIIHHVHPNIPQGAIQRSWPSRDKAVSQRQGGSPQRTDGPFVMQNMGQRPPYRPLNRPRSPDPKVRSTHFAESVPHLNASGLGMPATNA